MVVEYIRYSIGDGRAEAFEQAYRRAVNALDADPFFGLLRWGTPAGVGDPVTN